MRNTLIKLTRFFEGQVLAQSPCALSQEAHSVPIFLNSRSLDSKINQDLYTRALINKLSGQFIMTTKTIMDSEKGVRKPQIRKALRTKHMLKKVPERPRYEKQKRTPKVHIIN